MRKKFLHIILISVMAGTMLVGCANENTSSDQPSENVSAATTENSSQLTEGESTSSESTESVSEETSSNVTENVSTEIEVVEGNNSEETKEEFTESATTETEEVPEEIVASGFLEDADIEWKIVGTTLYVSGEGAIPNFENFPIPSNNSNAHLLRDWQPYYELVEKIVVEEGITKIGNKNFTNFVNTKEIIFSDSVVEIGKRSCMGMGLESIDFNNITKLNTQSFSTLKNMITLQIPGSIETIPDGCFNFCNNLKEVYIEEGVKTINELAFTTESGHWNCSIYLPVSITSFPSDTFNHDTIIYVKSGSKSQELLNEFADRYNITIIVE